MRFKDMIKIDMKAEQCLISLKGKYIATVPKEVEVFRGEIIFWSYTGENGTFHKGKLSMNKKYLDMICNHTATRIGTTLIKKFLVKKSY